MAYNAQATIRRTIESILNQTFENFQYYILDNASADDTEDIIGEYAEKDQRIVPLRGIDNTDTWLSHRFPPFLHSETSIASLRHGLFAHLDASR